jgi:elongation factor Ts
MRDMDRAEVHRAEIRKFRRHGMTVSAEQVKELREKTGVGFMECKSALQESKGDMDGAVTILRKRGLASAAKKSGRETKDGLVGAYIHNGKIGVMVEVNCETDFVARNPDFQILVKDLAMHIAASDPRFIRKEDVTEDVLASERDIYKAQALTTGKPENVLEKIVEGRMSKYFSEACLLEQPFVKDPSITVRDHIAAHVQKIGENIQVRRFIRYKLGE